MQRKVYLEGELGEKFGTSFTVHAENMQEIFRCIDANHDGFKKYLIDCHEKNVGFVIDVADKNIQHEPELLLPLKDGDVTVTVVPAGSKGFGKILAAIAIVAITIGTAGFTAPFSMGTLTSGFGSDDGNDNKFFDSWPTLSNNMISSSNFTCAVWVLIKFSGI